MPEQGLSIEVVIVGADSAVADAAKIGTAFETLGAKLDAMTGAMTKNVVPMTAMQKAHRDLSTTLSDLNTKMMSWSDTLQSKVATGLKVTTELTLGLATAMAAAGAAAANQMQSTTLAVQMYAGGSYAQNFKTTQALQALTNPLSLGTITGGYQGLLADNFSASQAMTLTKRVNDISSLTTDKSGTFSTLMAGIDEFQQSGMLNGMLVRQMQKAGLPIASSILAANPGMTPRTLSLMEQQGSPMLYPEFIQSIMAGTGPWAGSVGGRGRNAAQTAGGAFGEIRKDITFAVADALTNAKQNGPLDQATSWMAGLSTPGLNGQTRLQWDMSKAMPDIGKYISSLGRDLPDLAKNFEKLAQAAEPLGKMFLAVGQAIIPMVTAVERSATTLLKNPVVHFIEDIILYGSKLTPARDAVVMLFEALLAYKTIATVVGATQGLVKTLTSISTILGGSGNTSAAGMMATAGTNMLVASEQMLTASGVSDVGGAASGAGGGLGGLALGGGGALGTGAGELAAGGAAAGAAVFGLALQNYLESPQVRNVLNPALTGTGPRGLDPSALGLARGDKASVKGGVLTLPKGDRVQNAQGQSVTLNANLAINVNELSKGNASAVGGILSKHMIDQLEARARLQSTRGATGGGGGR